MFVPFNQLPSDSRIWIYQSDRPFTLEEEIKITSLLTPFTESWTAHSKDLAAGFVVLYHRFIILGIDEKMAMASGCSIDKSVHIILQVENELNLSLTNRLLYAYQNQEEVNVVHRNKFEALIANGEVGPNTIFFDNLIERKSDLDNKWEIPFEKSWHRQTV